MLNISRKGELNKRIFFGSGLRPRYYYIHLLDNLHTKSDRAICCVSGIQKWIWASQDDR